MSKCLHIVIFNLQFVLWCYLELPSINSFVFMYATYVVVKLQVFIFSAMHMYSSILLLMKFL